MKNLKLRTKLLLGFGITVLILLFIGIRQYMVLNELEDKRNDLTKSNEWADAIMEAKYAVKSDMQLLMEVLQTNSEQELNAYWSEHLGFVESYDTDMKNLINLSFLQILYTIPLIIFDLNKFQERRFLILKSA